MMNELIILVSLMIYFYLLVEVICKEAKEKGRIKVGVLCQYVVDKTGANSNPPFPSVRMAQLFYEFLARYNEWKLTRRQVTNGMILVFMLGLLALIIPCLFPKVGMPMSIAMLILFYFATRHYIKVYERVNHLYVNVNILHHHLMGKLEVGFCDHKEPCHCVENFCTYVLKNYNISFDPRFIK